MKGKRNMFFVKKMLPFVFCYIWICNTIFGQNNTEEKFTKQERSFHFVYTAQISKPKVNSKIQEIWLPVPQTNAYQDILNLKIKTPQTKNFNFYYDKNYNNKIAHIIITTPKQELTITMEFDCVRYESARANFKQPSPKNKKFLSPSKLLLVNNETRNEAHNITIGKKTTTSKLRSIYNKVMNKMRYEKPKDAKGNGIGNGWGDGSTLWASKKCFGNCTDFHAYYLSLARSLNIPSRFEIGAWIHADKEKGNVGYHCWALSWGEKIGWFPVDISEGWKALNKNKKSKFGAYYFGHLRVNRVGFTIGRDIELNPRQKAAPLNYFIFPYSEVDGKPIHTKAHLNYSAIESKL